MVRNFAFPAILLSFFFGCQSENRTTQSETTVQSTAQTETLQPATTTTMTETVVATTTTAPAATPALPPVTKTAVKPATPKTAAGVAPKVPLKTEVPAATVTTTPVAAEPVPAPAPVTQTHAPEPGPAPAPATQTTSASNPKNSGKAPKNHTVIYKGISHAPGADTPAAKCVVCHGRDLKGGKVAPSCFACHEKKWK